MPGQVLAQSRRFGPFVFEGNVRLSEQEAGLINDLFGEQLHLIRIKNTVYEQVADQLNKLFS